MNYEKFKDIAARHRVVPMNWPVTFKPPSKLTVLELHTLHSVLCSENPPVLFRKLTNAEWTLSGQAILNGTSPYLVPPFLHNAPPMPAPLLLTGFSTPASEAEPPSGPSVATAVPGPLDPAASAHTTGDDHSSLPTQPSPVLGQDNNSSPPGPGPRGGAIISFGDKPKKAPAKQKKKQTAEEKEARKKAQAIAKETQKAIKELEKQAKAAEKKAAAAKKKATGKKASGGKKGGKKGGKVQSQNVADATGSV